MIAGALGLGIRVVALAASLLAVATAAVAQTGDELARLVKQSETLREEGRYAEALPIAERALALAEARFGSQHASVAARLNTIGTLQGYLGRYPAAEESLRRAIAIREKTPGPESADLAQSLGQQAIHYGTTGRHGEAEPLLKRSLAIYEKLNSPRALGIAMGNLADNYRKQGRFREAEPLYKRTLDVHQKALGPEHQFVATTLSNLANMLTDEGRHREAEPLYERATAIQQKVLPADHPAIAIGLGNLAINRSLMRRYDDAEVLFRRSLDSLERRLGKEHPHVAVTVTRLAAMYQSQKRFADAEPLLRRGLEIQEKVFGPESPAVASTLVQIAMIHQQQQRHAEAEALLRRALSIREATLGGGHRLVASTLNALASLHIERSQWEQAVAHLLRSTDLAVRTHGLERETLGSNLTGARGETTLPAGVFVRLVKAAGRLGAADKARFSALDERLFLAAQWAKGSEAAASLAQMSVRQAKGDASLAQAIRERQDLVKEWRLRDAALLTATVEQPDRRNSDAENALRAKLDAVAARIKEIDGSLAAGFPEYAALANPEPLGFADVQAQLGENEALVLFLDTGEIRPIPEETFIWIVTKTAWRSARVERGTRAGLAVVADLRCGLDRAAWDGEGAAGCNKRLKLNLSAEEIDGGRPLPFDQERAYNVYKALLGGFEDIIKGKHLLIVPTGPFTALPFHVLVTEKPARAVPDTAAGYADTAWLIKRNAITVLPSVASLKALRQFARTSRATRPFVGFGNPLLAGPTGTDRRAWSAQSCGSPTLSVRVASRSLRSKASDLFRGGLANVGAVRAQLPLPETADELCTVARLTGASDEDVYLGNRATEKTIKGLSAGGGLAGARIVHFATHGLLAGEAEHFDASNAEPALILTPPETGTEEDDGLLTTSEVAELKLDADWDVLSACNTAAGVSDAPGSEALSGLARAFFYAGARALMVSHWAVDSEATVRLITNAFNALKAQPKLGRAEALRQSILAMIAAGGRTAHPSIWSPFVLVGEGGR